eukprot:365262-Chlamydomonas_euryale.AAC.8
MRTEALVPCAPCDGVVTVSLKRRNAIPRPPSTLRAFNLWERPQPFCKSSDPASDLTRGAKLALRDLLHMHTAAASMRCRP